MCLIGSMAHLGPVSLALIWTGSWSPGRWSSATTCSPAREGSEAGTGVGAEWTQIPVSRSWRGLGLWARSQERAPLLLPAGRRILKTRHHGTLKGEQRVSEIQELPEVVK